MMERFPTKLLFCTVKSVDVTQTELYRFGAAFYRTKENMQSDPDPPWISDAFKNVPNIRSMAKHPFMVQMFGTSILYHNCEIKHNCSKMYSKLRCFFRNVVFGAPAHGNTSKFLAVFAW